MNTDYAHLVQRNYGVMSEEQQEKLRHAKIAIVGVGCNGGMTAVILARMGALNLTLIDDDVYETSNINRQPFCNLTTVGEKKVIAAKKDLLNMMPHADITVHERKLGPGDASILAGHDVVVECVDHCLSRIVTHRLCEEAGLPSISMTGQPPFKAHVATFLPGGPLYEEYWRMPSLGKDIADPQVAAEIHEIKNARARHAAAHGAAPGWSEAFINKTPGDSKNGAVGWGITPERAYLTGTLQAHECVNLVTGRPPLAAAPKGIVINLLNAPNLIEVREEETWNYVEF